VSAPFGTLLRRLRIAASLSQEALAERAAVSAAAIGAYERGVRTAPHRDSVDLLAKALGLSAEARLEFEEAARAKPRGRVRLPSPDGHPSAGLPRETTAFIGREMEIAALTTLLREQRVVTLTGAGGVGKTRVALQAASRQHHADGVWFVDLGSVGDESRVVAKILSVVPTPALGANDTADFLAEALRDRSMLLILDNCEHVLEAAGAVVAALVRAAPNVTVLATTRRRLGVSAEFVLRLAPLPYPDSPIAFAAEARTYAAVELFVSRANAADGRFVFSDDHVAEVVEICRRVEGIPLALELAAARLPMFGLTGLRERLRDRLGPLKAHVRDAPQRQQTLRATIDWSYELLEERERLLLQRLAIFLGGCTLDSAEEVCWDASLPRDAIADVLSLLVDHSLVSCDFTSRVSRYTLLESTRQYAIEKAPAGEAGRLAARQALWCASFADVGKIETHPLTHTHLAGLVLPELDNIYQAIDWTTQHDRLLFARIVGSLYFLWWRIGRFDEGRRLAVDALSSLDEDAHPRVAAQLHLARSVSLSSAKKLEAAQRAIDLLEGTGEPTGLVEAYLHLGGGYLMTKEADRLRPIVEHVSQLAKRTGERNFSPLIAWLRGGLHLLEGKLEQARDELEIALAEPTVSEQEAGYQIGYQLADIESLLGNFERAAALSDELVAAARQRRMTNHEMYALVTSSSYHLLAGNTEQAKRSARDALLAARGINATILTTAIERLATIAAMRDDAVRAARLFGYVNAWFEREEHHHAALTDWCRDLLIASLDERLRPAEKEYHMLAGMLLSEESAIAEALLGPGAL
jgi:predicted ATPase/transcriptional regulator with XRE-family HTH domain